ncbi:MAG: hypothetical protein AAGI17_01885 [Planctomycetota bacterium]
MRRAQPGAPLLIRASDWNAIGDAVSRVGAVDSLGIGRAGGRSVVLRAINADDNPAIPVGGIVELDEPAGTEAEVAGTGERPSRPVGTAVKVKRPTGSSRRRRFGVALDGIAERQTGRVMTMGVAWCRVTYSDDAHEFAIPADGQYEANSAHAGPLRILGTGYATGTRWAWCEVDPAFAVRRTLAEISGNAANGDNRFRYGGSEVEGDGSAVTDGLVWTTTAGEELENRLEINNAATGRQGNQIDLDADSGSSTFTFLAVADGTIVEVSIFADDDGTVRSQFSVPNGITVACS